jgi:hypothetical protein
MAKKKTQKYWKNKIDLLLREHARDKRCELCGVIPSHYHHLLPKSRYACFRGNRSNLVRLCPTHHTFGSECSAHSTCFRAVERFIEWLKLNKPEQYQWVKDNENNRLPSGKPDYEGQYSTLLEELK